MFNELLFLLHIAVVGFFTLFFLFVSKEALITFICLQTVLANLFVIKQISLFGLNVTCTDVFIISAVLGTNLLQEYYSRDVAKKTVYLNLAVLVFYLVASQMHLLYIPSQYDSVNNLYSGILQFMPRIIAASVATFFVVQRIDVAVYAMLKKYFHNKYLWGRNIFALVLSQLIDTGLFSFLGLYGIVNSIFDVMVLSFVIKVGIIFLSSPVIVLSKKVMNKFGKPFETPATLRYDFLHTARPECGALRRVSKDAVLRKSLRESGDDIVHGGQKFAEGQKTKKVKIHEQI